MADYMYKSKYKKLHFEWDPTKDITNQEKHGVAFEEAKSAFDDPNFFILDDLLHTKTERRFFGYGKTGKGILTVRFTIRDSQIIRIIGAAYWRKGKRLYEEKAQKE